MSYDELQSSTLSLTFSCIRASYSEGLGFDPFGVSVAGVFAVAAEALVGDVVIDWDEVLRGSDADAGYVTLPSTCPPPPDLLDAAAARLVYARRVDGTRRPTLRRVARRRAVVAADPPAVPPTPREADDRPEAAAAAATAVVTVLAIAVDASKRAVIVPRLVSVSHIRRCSSHPLLLIISRLPIVMLDIVPLPLLLLLPAMSVIQLMLTRTGDGDD